VIAATRVAVGSPAAAVAAPAVVTAGKVVNGCSI
jgi:hypothetical protein